MNIKLILLILVTNVALNTTLSDKEDLVGSWKIDLRPTPNAKAYFQSFEIKGVKGKKITGKFYGSTIKNGLINTDWGKIYFAFETRDANHSYYHSGYLKNGKLVGQSYCPGRNFTIPWRGSKQTR